MHSIYIFIPVKPVLHESNWIKTVNLNSILKISPVKPVKHEYNRFKPGNLHRMWMF